MEGEIVNQQLSQAIEALGNDVQDLGDGAEIQLTPDGKRVVYLADEDYDGVVELYSARVDGEGSPLKLNRDLAPPISERLAVADRIDVTLFAMVPAGPKRGEVVYGVGQPTKFDLWIVDPTDPSGRRPLLPEGDFPARAAGTFVITPDGSRVVVNAFRDKPNRELFSVSIDEPESVLQLSEGTVESPNRLPLNNLVVDAKSERVVYIPQRDNHERVFSAEVGEAESEVHLNDDREYSGSSGGITDLAISSDAEWVIYRGREFTGRRDVVSVPIRGGAIQRISHPNADGVLPREVLVSKVENCDQVLYLTNNGFSYNELWSVSANGAGLVRRRRGFLGDHAIAPSGCNYAYTHDGVLYAGAFGSAATNISRDGGSTVDSFVFHPDGQQITFLADRNTDDVFELYSLPVEGGAATRVTDRPDLRIQEYKVVVDESGTPHAIFVALDEEDTARLFSATVDDEVGVVELSGRLEPGGGVVSTLEHLIFSKSENRVIFTADKDRDDVIELYSVPLTGGPVARLNRGNSPVGDIEQFWSTVDKTDGEKKWIVYRGNATMAGRFDLYAVPADRSEPAERISEFVERTSVVDVGDKVVFTSDGSRVIFAGPAKGSGTHKLFMHTFATRETRQLSPDAVASNSRVTGFLLHPDPNETAIFYLADHEEYRREELYRCDFADSDPAGTVTRLLAEQEMEVIGRIAEDFAITEDHRYLIFRGLGENRVFRLNLISGEVVSISGTLKVHGFQLAPRGAKVVLWAELAEDDSDRLFVVDVESPGAPRDISGSLVAAGGVAGDFAITFDGNKVVFRAEAGRLNRHGLFSVDLGNANPSRVDLIGSLDLDSLDVEDFVLNEADTQNPGEISVAFRAGRDASPDQELYVAIIGVANSARRASPEGTHGDVDVTGDYAYTPDGTAVFFRCDPLVDEHFGLYRFADSETKMAHPPLQGQDTVLSFSISPDSYRVAYVLGQRHALDLFSNPSRLFSTRTFWSGETPEEPTLMSLAKGEYHDVAHAGELSYLPDSSQLLFLDDREKDETWELYTAFDRLEISQIENQLLPLDGVREPIPFTVMDLETPPSNLEIVVTSMDQGLIADSGIALLPDENKEGGWLLSLTPVRGASGTTSIKVTARGYCEVGEEEFEVCIGDVEADFEAWLRTYFETTPLAGGRLGDPDKDGLVNLEEWSKGLDPSRADRHRDVYAIRREGAETILRYRRAKPFPKGLRISYESSTSLLPDSWIPLAEESISVIGTIEGAELVEVRFAAPDAAPDTLFLRMVYR